MYYDTYRGKNRRGGGRRRRETSGCLGHFLLRLVVFLLVVVVLAAGLLYILPVSFINVEKAGAQVSPKDGLPADRVNILLLGLDFRDEGMQRTDAILIASVGGGEMKLTSVQRDLEVDIPGHGKGKVNAAYNYGGAETVMRVLNELLDLNITRYAAVDFMTMVDLVDAVGGIDIEIAEDEIDYLNHYGANTLKKITSENAGKYAPYMEKYKTNVALGTPVVTAAGLQHLDGLFTVAYSRIRYVGLDYGRAYRQRKVMNAIVDRMRSNFYKPAMYKKLLDVFNNSVKTNLSLPEALSLGEKVLLGGKIVTDSNQRIPYPEYTFDQYGTGKGSNLEITDRAATVKRLHDFIYK